MRKAPLGQRAFSALTNKSANQKQVLGCYKCTLILKDAETQQNDLLTAWC